MSPIQRSLIKLRDDGFACEVVERWNPFAKCRKDLFGFVDILALGNGMTLGVQVTSASNMASRIKKISEHENISAVRQAGWWICVHGWRKSAKGEWVCIERDLS